MDYMNELYNKRWTNEKKNDQEMDARLVTALK